MDFRIYSGNPRESLSDLSLDMEFHESCGDPASVPRLLTGSFVDGFLFPIFVFWVGYFREPVSKKFTEVNSITDPPPETSAGSPLSRTSDFQEKGKHKVWRGDISWILVGENEDLIMLSIYYQRQKGRKNAIQPLRHHQMQGQKWPCFFVDF